MTSLAQTTQSPWTPYSAQGNAKGHPVVPETELYGLLLAGWCFCFYAFLRVIRNNKQ